MSGMRKGSKPKTQTLSSKTQNVGSSSSISHPGSCSRPQFPLATERRNTIIEEKEDETADWTAHPSPQPQQDDVEVTSECDTVPRSQGPQRSP